MVAPQPSRADNPEGLAPPKQTKLPKIVQHQLIDGNGEVRCTWTITGDVADYLNRKNEAEGDPHRWLPVPVEEPKQLKLLGAVVKGLGVVTTVSTTLFDCFCLIEDVAGREHHRFLKDLSRDELTYQPEVPSYFKHSRRVGIGVWDDMYSLQNIPDVGAVLEAAA